MKLNLFLLASIFAALHLSKAGPLRLHKRAAFYIANETACVVDNIVYSNGDPIPTDDPCEACKCRPPGFACVLKECKVKPGCRAVRHAGHCCPEYVCGCEHNGRMYQDGEEIRDETNPCYICHCQGSSIACAFVDCFFRVDCIPVYVPGECCPDYTNCTGDAFESNSFNEDNAQPSLNLLPALNDEFIIPANLPTTLQEPESSEIPTNPSTEPSVVADISEETVAPETKATTDESNESQTTAPDSSVSEENKLDPVVEEKITDEITTSSENKTDESPKDEIEDKNVEEGEWKVLFNSETEIKKDENAEITTVKSQDSTEHSEEVVNDDPETTIANDEKEVTEAKVTEKPLEFESTSTGNPTTEKQVKNSAADHSKSLKLLNDETGTEEQSKKSEKERIKTEEPEKSDSKLNETVTQSPTESSSQTESVDATENKQESEESQNNPQVALYSNDDKIKSESAETVTIVVHVKEKAKPTTETDFVSEQVTPESVTSETQKNLLKSNDELTNTKISTEVERVTSAGTNFEVFPSSTEKSKEESSTNPPVTDEKSKEEAKGRSEETEPSTSDAEENITNNENITDLKNEESSVATTTQNVNDITESTPAESRADEEETKADDPTEQVTKIEEPIKIKVTTDSETEISKNEEPTESESGNEERNEKTTSEESVDEIKPEVRDDDSKPEEKETTLTKTIEDTTPIEKTESTSPETDEIKPEERTAETGSGEKTNTENIENTEENKIEATTESKDQGTKELTQTEAPKKDNE